MYPSHFAKRWTHPSTKTVLYYPLYGGYHSSNCPVLFANPMHAMTWAITRFKKDGICNAWAGKTLPDFLHFVGVFKCDQSEVSEIDIPVYSRSSKIEKDYFSIVSFYALLDTDLQSSVLYLKCRQEDFTLCMSTLQDVQDYHMSSNSIYRKGHKCPTVSPDNFKYIHYKMLEDKLNSAANHFIQLENKFFYLKYGSNRDPGKSSMLSLKNVMAVSLINTHFCFGSDKLIDILHSYVQASQTSPLNQH
jgi:hypothetical protein